MNADPQAETPGPSAADEPDDDADAPVGIACPRCGCEHLPAVDGRVGWMVTKTERKRGHIRRRRKCRHCGRIVYTREVIDPS